MAISICCSTTTSTSSPSPPSSFLCCIKGIFTTAITQDQTNHNGDRCCQSGKYYLFATLGREKIQSMDVDGLLCYQRHLANFCCFYNHVSWQGQNNSPPRLTRVLAVIIITLSALAQTPWFKRALVDNLSLVPNATVTQSKLWNVVTCGLFDTQILASFINTGIVLTIGKWIESSWGLRPMLIYILLVNTLSGIITYIFHVFSYVLLKNASFFTGMATSNGLCMALLIAIKQLIPDHVIGSTSPTVNISANYLPLLYLCLILVLTILSIFPVGVFIFSISSLQLSWVYLRYFQYHPSDASLGDSSESFAFSTFFPLLLRPVIDILANFSFMAFKPCLIFLQSSSAALLQSSNHNPDSFQQQPPQHGLQHHLHMSMPMQDAAHSHQLPTKTSAMDTERRRQRALKVLDERMQASTTNSTANTTLSNSSTKVSTNTVSNPITTSAQEDAVVKEANGEAAV